MTTTTGLSEADLRDFLRKLDEAEVEVTQWEAPFVGNCMDLDRFTPAQRNVIERLIAKYGDRIGW